MYVRGLGEEKEWKGIINNEYTHQVFFANEYTHQIFFANQSNLTSISDTIMGF